MSDRSRRTRTGTVLVHGAAALALLFLGTSFAPAAGSDLAAVEEGATSHLVLQPADPRDTGWRARLDAAGIRLLHYLPDGTWIASVPGEIARGQRGYPGGTRAARPLEPAQRVAPTLRSGERLPWAEQPGGRLRLRVRFFLDVAPARRDAILCDIGAQVLTRPGRRGVAEIVLDRAAIERLGRFDEVAWVSDAPPAPVELNDGALDNTGADVLDAPPYSLDGQGISLAMWDSGIVDGSHPDLAGRVTAGEVGAVGAHATHVAGTMAGDGSNSLAQGGTPLQWRGTAPEADIVSYFFDAPVDDHDDAINVHGVDVSQNSWGFEVSGATATCEKYGDYIWDAPEFDAIVTGLYGRRLPVVFAVGNERDDGDCGIAARAGFACLAPPATAKNVITVGAIHSNNDSMTVFSSWGPADDGRLRPDIVAPGCQTGGDLAITSTDLGGGYIRRCGTSMAAPSASGALALLLQQHRLQSPALPDPLPSTLKGLLIQTARELGPAGPDFRFGYGALDAQGAVDALRHTSVFEDSVDVAETREIAFTVQPGTAALQVTLVWDDVPAVEGANPTLVNNLDLALVAPDLGQRLPLVLAAATPESVAVPGVDNVNNVEQVRVASPAAGLWTCRVSGTSVPMGPQRFSLLGLDLRAPGAAGALALQAVGDSTIHVRWTNPDDLDFAGTLGVRSLAATGWSPPAGAAYLMGQEVAPGVFVVQTNGADHSITPLADGPLPIGATAHYRLFAYDGQRNYAAVAADSVTVGNPVPVVVDASPVLFARGVAAGAPIAFTFSTPLDTTTVTASSVRVVGSVSGPRAASLSFAAGHRDLLIDPAGDFLAGEEVHVVLTSAIESAYGYTLDGGFTLRFEVEAPGTGQGLFSRVADVPVGANAGAAALADLDGDGLPEALVGDGGAGAILVAHNDNGILVADSSYAAGGAAKALATGDVDGDGRADVLAAIDGADALVVWRSLGDGRLEADSTYALGGAPGGIAAGDLDGDGLCDVAVTVEADSTLVVFTSAGGTLVPSALVVVGAAPRGVAAGDVDGDGDLDLAVAASFLGKLTVLRNDGAGAFTPAWSVTTPGKPSELLLAELDGDGDLDLAIVRRNTGQVEVRYNDGGGSFGTVPGGIHAVGTLPWGIAAADADGDDDLDLMVAVKQGALFGILRRGTSGFGPFESWPVGGQPVALACGDIDHDQDVDAWVAVQNAARGTVFLNVNGATSVDGPGGRELRLALHGVRPNPFRPGESALAFSLDAARAVEIALYDVSGRRVVTLLDRVLEAGFHEVRWDGRDAAGREIGAGVYFVRMRAGGDTLTRKVVVAR